jgi:PAS domain S-box-containing protein
MLLAAFSPCVFSLNPTLDVSQYAHKAWAVRDGFFKGAIYAIAQTPDGYLWIGTEFGLVRFDGVRTLEWQPPNDKQLPGGPIRSLLTARDGRLWIGTGEGVASWKDGKLTHYPELDRAYILSLLEDHEGTIWAAGTVGNAEGRLCAIRAGRVECYGTGGSLGKYLPSLFEDRMGTLWVGTDKGVWRWRPAPAKLFPVSDLVLGLAENDDRELLVSTQGGIKKLVNERVEPYAPPGASQRFTKLLRDRDGGLWVGSLGGGIFHVRQGRTDQFSDANGLSGDGVQVLFEDREGSIWSGTTDGLDRFREFAIPTITAKQGLSNSAVYSVLTARDGAIWLGTENGLDRWNSGQVTLYGARHGLPDASVFSLLQDQAGRIWASTRLGIAYSEEGKFKRVPGVPDGFPMVVDSSGDLWIATARSLFHLRSGPAVEEIPWLSLGRQDLANAMLADPVQGGVWFGFLRGGVAYFKDGQLRASYSRADELGEGRVNGFTLDRDSTLWAATQGGLSQIKNGRVLTLSVRNGLPCNTVYWMMEDDDHFFWLYTACGLLQIGRRELDAWAGDPARAVHPTVFDNTDGVRIVSGISVTGPAKSADGRIWFLPGDGVSVIDPRHLPVNKLPPPVHIEKVFADEKEYNLTPGLRLPALTRDLRIEYTALSFVAPEKVRFKVKLEGQDRDWMDEGTQRQTHYSNLKPRNYRFRVIASNNSGVWNETGDMLEFSIAPAFYQTNWFIALLAAAAIFTMAAAYRVRMWQVQREARRLRDVIETIPAYVWSAQPDGSIDFVNRRWLEFSGFSMDRALGWGWADAVHPEDRPGLLEAWRGAIKSGEAMEAEARMREADGQYRWMQFRAVPQRDEAGKLVKWYGKSTDIEDSKRAEQERERVRQLETDLAHINRVSMMGELSASIAHEVNQPLTGIVSNAGAAMRFLDGDTPNVEEVREAIRDIARDGKRAGEVIARIRALTKRTSAPAERLDLNEIIREVLAIVGDQARKNNVAVRTELADGLAPVSGDHVQLQQVLLNLIMNAMDAMNAVSDRPRQLAITTRNIDPGQVQVTVQDSGAGLDPNAMPRIFDAFYTTKPTGMGMGLSISRSIVEKHGGRIWATANDGPGTSFHFRLPKYDEQHAGAKSV